MKKFAKFFQNCENHKREICVSYTKLCTQNFDFLCMRSYQRQLNLNLLIPPQPLPEKKRKFSFPSCRIFFQPCPEKDRFNINPTSYNSIHPTTRGEAVIITMMCMALHECTISSSLLTGVSMKTLPEAQWTHALTRWRHQLESGNCAARCIKQKFVHQPLVLSYSLGFPYWHHSIEVSIGFHQVFSEGSSLV